MKAMIFAAGLGTRLENETTDKPKALVEVGGKLLLQYAIEKLKNTGITEIVINVHHFSERIINWLKFQNFNLEISVSDETNLLLETGGGLKKAACFLRGNEPVLIYNVDILSNINLQLVEDEHLKSGSLATLVVRKRQTQRYFLFDENKRLSGWINKKTGETKGIANDNVSGLTEMAFSGIHVVSPKIFELMPPENIFSITDLYLNLLKDYQIKGYYDTSELWMDVGKPSELTLARNRFK